jgi:hypothetical protein
LEDFQPLGRRLWPPQFLGVDEFFTAAPAGGGQFLRFGEAINFIQQHCLADATQTSEQNAFLGTLFFDATEENASLVEGSLSTDHFGRWRTCAGRERVLDGVHTMLCEFLVIYTNF